MSEDKIELTIGQILQQKRHSLNINIIEASSYLKVKVRDIEAIENDNFEEVTKHIYLLGLIRSYARFLKIEEKNIEEKITKVFVRSNVDNKEHKLVNIGEENNLVPPKDMFFNFLLISSLVFFVLLSIFNSLEKNSSIISSTKIIQEMENLIAEND